MSYILVGIGGAIGSIARYLLSLWFNPTTTGIDFPKGTFIANILGCLCIGIFAHWASMEGRMSAEMKLLLLTGFCGGFTTFSTFSIEGLAFLKNEAVGMYAVYTLLSIILGVVAVAGGYWLAKTV